MREGSIRQPITALGTALLLLGVGCTGDLDGSGDNAPEGMPQAPGSPETPSTATPGTPGTPGAPGTNTPGTPGAPGTGTPGNPTPPGAGTANPPPASPQTSSCTATPSVPPTPLRRLTRFEYANSVKTLLNVDVSAEAATLPVDEITNGFNNNAAVLTVSLLHAEKYVLIAEAAAKKAVADLATLTGCDAAVKGEDTCASEFAKKLGRRAYRRPTTADDEAALLAAYQAGKEGGSYTEGIEVMVRAVLQSPDFLYKLELTPPAQPTDRTVPLNQYEIASRLAYLLWSSGPDDALLDAAGKSELSTKEQVATRARAMLQDPRAKLALSEFYGQWLGTTRLDVTSKNTTLFPTFSEAVRADLIQELPKFLDFVMFQGDHKLATLLTSPQGYVTPALAPVYGVSAPSGGPALMQLPETQGRSGILTQAAFLSVQAHPDQTSPVLRGKFVRSKLLCQTPPPPPDDVNISVPEVSANSTARERFSAHSEAGSSCNGCHQMMDPIGFAFENFDAVGSFRTTENGKAIDVSGEVVGTTDPALAGAFVGVKALGQKLAASKTVRDCVATQWFRFASGRSESEPDSCSIATLQESFNASQGDLVELAVGITQTESFWYRGVAQEVTQ